MREIPLRSKIVADLLAAQTAENEREVEAIGNSIVGTLERCRCDPGALLFASKMSHIPEPVATELFRRFAEKGWQLVFTKGVNGGRAIFLA